MKKCKHCQQVKPIAEFSIKDKGKPGALCRVCAAKKHREWYAEKKDEISINRSVRNLNRTLNVLRRKATDSGYKINITYTDRFVVTMEKLPE